MTWRFWDKFQSGQISPRAMCENLTLEKCARQYMYHVRNVSGIERLHTVDRDYVAADGGNRRLFDHRIKCL